jgi:uncharacterized membrane protein YkoI
MLWYRMKARLLMIGLLFAGALIGQEEVALSQLPAAVRHTLEQKAGGNPVKKITRQIINGEPTYLVEIDRPHALNPRFRIAETGELVPSSTAEDAARLALDPLAPATAIDSPAETLTELPEAVQQIVRNEAQGRETADIKRKTSQGRTIYEIEFRAPGRNPKIRVAADGTLLRDDESRKPVRNFLTGTELINTPAAVQATVQREAAGRQINHIDVKRQNGEVVYEVEILDPQSARFRLIIAASGRILEDSRTPQPKP